MLEVPPLLLNGRHSLDSPSNRKIQLLVFPVFYERHTPENVHHSIYGGEVAKEDPGREAKSCGKDQEREIGLGEGKIESNLSH